MTQIKWRKCSFHPIRTKNEIRTFCKMYRRFLPYRAENKSANFSKRYCNHRWYRVKFEIPKFLKKFSSTYFKKAIRKTIKIPPRPLKPAKPKVSKT